MYILPYKAKDLGKEVKYFDMGILYWIVLDYPSGFNIIRNVFIRGRQEYQGERRCVIKAEVREKETCK